MANSTSPAAASKASAAAAKASAAAKAAAAKALRQRNNENAPKWFAVGVGGIIVLAMIVHWARYLYKRSQTSKKRSSSILKIPVSITRVARRILLLQAPGFVSTGHSLVYISYVAVILAVTFTNIDWSNLVGLSKRLGWVTVGNIAFVIFLSLKHTPLAFLVAISYEKIQPLHQVAGYTTVACWFCHAIIYLTAWTRLKNLHDLTQRDNIMGIVAGVCMALLFLFTFIRNVKYELFHATHVFLVVCILVFSALHRPELLTVQHSTYGLIFAASIWVLDLTFRSSKLAIYRLGNGATLTPLPHGGTRVVLRKKVLGAKPGKNLLLHLPKIQTLGLHPFTINSIDPVEMVIVANKGFTKVLNDYANAHPGGEIAASVDGPYGSLPDFTGADRVLFIAGGSGASFNIGVALDVLKNQSQVKKVDFVWVVRHTDQLSWFQPQLFDLSSNPRVSLNIHVTHHHSPNTASNSVTSLSDSAPTIARDPEKSGSENSSHDPEKAILVPTSLSQTSLTTHSGRPNITNLVKAVVEGAEEGERIMVVGCGPDKMMLEVRMAVASSLRASGPSVEMHLEHFAW